MSPAPDSSAGDPPITEEEREQLMERVFAPRNRADLAGALKEMARSIRKQNAEPPLRVPYPYWQHAKSLRRVINWAEKKGIVAGWSHISKKDDNDSEYFGRFVMLAEQRF